MTKKNQTSTVFTQPNTAWICNIILVMSNTIGAIVGDFYDGAGLNDYSRGSPETVR